MKTGVKRGASQVADTCAWKSRLISRRCLRPSSRRDRQQGAHARGRLGWIAWPCGIHRCRGAARPLEASMRLYTQRKASGALSFLPASRLMTNAVHRSDFAPAEHAPAFIAISPVILRRYIHRNPVHSPYPHGRFLQVLGHGAHKRRAGAVHRWCGRDVLLWYKLCDLWRRL